MLIVTYILFTNPLQNMTRIVFSLPRRICTPNEAQWKSIFDRKESKRRPQLSVANHKPTNQPTNKQKKGHYYHKLMAPSGSLGIWHVWHVCDTTPALLIRCCSSHTKIMPLTWGEALLQLELWNLAFIVEIDLI